MTVAVISSFPSPFPKTCHSNSDTLLSFLPLSLLFSFSRWSAFGVREREAERGVSMMAQWGGGPFQFLLSSSLLPQHLWFKLFSFLSLLPFFFLVIAFSLAGSSVLPYINLWLLLPSFLSYLSVYSYSYGSATLKSKPIGILITCAPTTYIW